MRPARLWSGRGRRRVVTVPSLLHGKAAESHNPATKEVVARFSIFTLEVRAAVDSAEATFKVWRDKPNTARDLAFGTASLGQQTLRPSRRPARRSRRSAIADVKEDVFRGLEVAENGCDIRPHCTWETRTWTATPFSSPWVTAVASLPATSPPGSLFRWRLLPSRVATRT